MINVTSDYRNRARANGRSVYCIIRAGARTFTDSEILGFEFSDTVCAEELAFGSTCASRFHFELCSGQDIPLTDVIKPYIGFDGSDELCPLGEFYISRRYRRRSRTSITCYDRMYRLDSSYKTSLTFPQPMSAVLSELTERLGITCTFGGGDYVCRVKPENATDRDVIGYIAGACGGCAKFDRSGVLTLKTFEHCGEVIMRDELIDLSVKTDPLEIRQIDLYTDTECFSAGSGTKLTTYRQYNQFAGTLAAQGVYNMWNGFTYHGLEAYMQGLPYLEAGDRITVQSDTPPLEGERETYYTALITGLDFVYDGSLRVTLSSFSKNPIDDFADATQSDMALENVRTDMTLGVNGYTNETAVILGTTARQLARIDFDSQGSAAALFGATFVASSTADCILTLYCVLNGGMLPLRPRQSLAAGGSQTVCLHDYLAGLAAGSNSLALYAAVTAGTVTVAPNQLRACVFGQFMSGVSVTPPYAELSDGFTSFSARVTPPSLGTAWEEELGTLRTAVVSRSINAAFSSLDTVSELSLDSFTAGVSAALE